MKESERSAFDEQWKDAFEEAEVSPASSVWSNLDRELALAEGKESKRRVLFYQRLAAASVVFALMAGSFGAYHWKQNTMQVAQVNSKKIQTVHQSNLEPNSVGENAEVKSNSASENKIEGTEIKASLNDARRSRQQKQIESSSDSFVEKQRVAIADQNKKVDDQFHNELGLDGGEKSKSDLEWYAGNLDATLPLLPEESVKGGPTFKEYVRKLPAISAAFMMERKPRKVDHEKLWASVVASSGTYTENNGRSSYAVASAQSNNSNNSVNGSSFSVGVLGGVRVSKRWVVQSGVQYMNQSASYSSNISTASLNSVSSFALDHSSVAPSAVSSSYDIISTNQFVTVPMQAGYLLVDKKLGWQVNPGVATDFFVRNTLSDPSGQRQSYSQGAGSDSPYRSVNFSGLMSSEVSYKLGRNYRISLVPGVRYFFNPVLKSQTTGNPLVWDVGFRFRYIFK